MRRILYLGPCNPEKTVQTRGLTIRNAAAFNRMLRIAQALSEAGRTVLIVSTGINLRARSRSGLFQGAEDHTEQGVPIHILPAVVVPVVGFLMEPWILSFWLALELLRDRPQAVMVYNSTIPYLMAGGLARLFAVHVIYEVEDVPTWAAVASTRQHGIVRQLQELSCLMASKLLTRISSTIVVPSKKFITELGLSSGKAAKCIIVSGCMKVTARAPKIVDLPIRRRRMSVLFAGMMESEQGFDLLLEAIRTLSADRGASDTIEFHLCGSLGREFKKTDIPADGNVHFHGYVSDERYLQILGDADVGLALQRSDGLYRNAKTPSKAYEFLAAGKLLIATGAGDLDELYPERALRLDPETGARLAELLRSIAGASDRYAAIAARGLTYARDRFSLGAVGRLLELAVNY